MSIIPFSFFLSFLFFLFFFSRPILFLTLFCSPIPYPFHLPILFPRHPPSLRPHCRCSPLVVHLPAPTGHLPSASRPQGIPCGGLARELDAAKQQVDAARQQVEAAKATMATELLRRVIGGRRHAPAAPSPPSILPSVLAILRREPWWAKDQMPPRPRMKPRGAYFFDFSSTEMLQRADFAKLFDRSHFALTPLVELHQKLVKVWMVNPCQRRLSTLTSVVCTCRSFWETDFKRGPLPPSLEPVSVPIWGAEQVLKSFFRNIGTSFAGDKKFEHSFT